MVFFCILDEILELFFVYAKVYWIEICALYGDAVLEIVGIGNADICCG